MPAPAEAGASSKRGGIPVFLYTVRKPKKRKEMRFVLVLQKCTKSAELEVE